MKTVAIDSIIVPPKRQRSSFNEAALGKLQDSIATQGLFHALLIEEKNGTVTLVAGERRLRALRLLHKFGVQFYHDGEVVPLDHAPVVTLGDVSFLAAREAEFSENTNREQLTWQENAFAIADLQELRTLQHGKQTFLATARELAEAKGTPLVPMEEAAAITEVSKAVIISKHLGDEEVAKAKTAGEALKIIEKKTTKAHNEALAAALGKIQTFDRHVCICGDAIAEMAQLPSESIDVILTDPPYGIEAHDFGSQAFHEHDYDDSYEAWNKLMKDFAIQATRVAKPASHLYCFCDVRMFNELALIFRFWKWRVFNTPLIWVKSGGMLPLPEHGPRRTYECILYAFRGDRKVTAVYNDVIVISPERETPHPAQKPMLLYYNLLMRSVRPGDKVLDPFCGSGTIFAAANKLQLTATGIELNPAFYALAVGRIKENL